MMWNGGSGGWWALGALFMLGCMVMMVRMMSHGHGSHGTQTGSPGQPSGGAEQILAERLARGEIDVEAYERSLAALRRTSEFDQT